MSDLQRIEAKYLAAGHLLLPRGEADPVSEWTYSDRLSLRDLLDDVSDVEPKDGELTAEEEERMERGS